MGSGEINLSHFFPPLQALPTFSSVPLPSPWNAFIPSQSNALDPSSRRKVKLASNTFLWIILNPSHTKLSFNRILLVKTSVP